MRKCALVPLVVCTGGCLLESNQVERQLSAPTVLAIEADPAEAPPGTPVKLRAVVASPEGPVETDAVRWSFCRTPRPLSENGAVSARCATENELPQPGRALEAELVLPADGCVRFGPETAAGLRPTDPDASGGYYQPLRVSVPDARATVQRLRLRCALANAPIATVQEFAARYRDNGAPGQRGIRLAETDALRAVVGSRVELQLALEPDAHEHYVHYDPARGLVEREETLRVRWYVSAGALADESPPGPEHASARWSAPHAPGTAWVWAVLGDDRGGLSVATAEIEVWAP
jgi:hypothetical protein